MAISSSSARRSIRPQPDSVSRQQGNPRRACSHSKPRFPHPRLRGMIRPLLLQLPQSRIRDSGFKASTSRFRLLRSLTLCATAGIAFALTQDSGKAPFMKESNSFTEVPALPILSVPGVEYDSPSFVSDNHQGGHSAPYEVSACCEIKALGVLSPCSL